MLKLEEQVKSNGGTVGATALDDFAGSYRGDGFMYCSAGVVEIPTKIEDALFSEPLHNTDGSIRMNRQGLPIKVKGLLVKQGGETTRLTLGTFQRTVRVYTKDGDPVYESDGAAKRVSASGEVVDDYKKHCAADTKEAYMKFFNLIAGKKLHIKLDNLWTMSNGKPVPTNVATVTYEK